MGNILSTISEMLFKDANVLVQLRRLVFCTSGQYIIGPYYILGRSLCH